MKLQITKNKSVEIGFGGGKRKKGLSDVTGVEINSSDPRGCPAVRLARKKDGWHVLEAGFVPPPPGEAPASWAELAKQVTWSLPAEFQAPHAAFAVATPDSFTRQTTPEGLSTDSPAGPTPSTAAPAKRKLGVRRPENEDERKSAETASGNVPAAPGKFEPGVPLSRSGVRSVMRPLADESFLLQAGLPEYQALWFSRLLPEGKRPTVCSIQTVPAALLASLVEQPEFETANGTAAAVFATPSKLYVAGYRDGRPVLFRECPDAGGTAAMREAVKTGLGLGDDLVDSVLEDALVDPKPVLEPFLRPVFRQLELSLGFLSGRYGLTIGKIFLFGIPSGGACWKTLAEEALRVQVIAPDAFGGFKLPAKAGHVPNGLTAGKSQVFLAALGAARAAMEVPA